MMKISTVCETLNKKVFYLFILLRVLQCDKIGYFHKNTIQHLISMMGIVSFSFLNKFNMSSKCFFHNSGLFTLYEGTQYSLFQAFLVFN